MGAGEDPKQALEKAGLSSAWLPHYIARAHRVGTAGDDDLLSGRAWAEFAERLGRAGARILADDAPAEPADRAAGYRHLMVLVGLGVDQALRVGDPGEPRLGPALMDNAYKWGMDCPDAAYLGCGLRGDAAYRIHGNRGTVRYLGFQAMAGMANVGNVVAEDLDVAPDGSFELWLSADERPGNWMRLDPRASSMTVRQFFYDWDREEPARLTIERVSGEATPGGVPELTPALVARQLGAIADFIEASVEFWMNVENAGREQGLNRFREPNNITEMGAAAENVSVWGSWEVAPDEALVIEVTPPEALYWSVSLGNFWWETIDYANHQSSLNGHQALLDADGVFRAVVAHRDPGVPNWLDTTGQHRGPAIFRWLCAADAPVPETRLVKLADLESALPADTPHVTAATRREQIARRRAHVRRRYPR